ncbi:hypothetical protein ACH5RR_026770 [Cinchona calisaya]|uniref:FAF domain-containing protein n=1 Tax=Cinchona calisaya TaxID=153742 RepID=A0ABD2Z8H8_9GENT
MTCSRYSFESIAIDLGDCIGMESCDDLKSSTHDEFCMAQRCQRSRRNNNQRLAKIEKEYPPPIPWLARTGNLPSHMPWIMKRYYTNDGRLIIKEEKVKRHEYFQAYRSNGRLILYLVPLDDYALVDDHDDEEEEVDCDRNIDGREDDQTDVEEEEELRTNVSESCMESGRDVISGGGHGGGGGRGCELHSRSTSRTEFLCV